MRLGPGGANKVKQGVGIVASVGDDMVASEIGEQLQRGPQIAGLAAVSMSRIGRPFSSTTGRSGPAGCATATVAARTRSHSRSADRFTRENAVGLFGSNGSESACPFRVRVWRTARNRQCLELGLKQTTCGAAQDNRSSRRPWGGCRRCDDVGQVACGSTPVATGLDERDDHGPMFGTAVGAGEQGVLAHRCKGADAALDDVVVDPDVAVVEEQPQSGVREGNLLADELELGAQRSRSWSKGRLRSWPCRPCLLRTLTDKAPLGRLQATGATVPAIRECGLKPSMNSFPPQ
jgi:hypothetical protein